VLDSSLFYVRASEIERAADVAVRSALCIQPSEKFVVVLDDDSSNVGLALALAAEKAGAECQIIDLDQMGTRPLPALSDWGNSVFRSASVSAFVARAPRGEIGLRQEVLHLAAQRGMRHAHMPDISSLAFARGMRIDYQEVAAYGRRLLEKVSGAKRLRATSPRGTNLEIVLDEPVRWFAQFGILEKGRWGNLPAGALYASPRDVEGQFVADASLGEYFGMREQCLLDKPVRFIIEYGRVTGVRTQDPDLQREIERMLDFADNSDRVGLVALGVNFGISEPTGEALVDQNMPGLHIAIGDPAANITGVKWSARTSFAACQSSSSVYVGDAAIIQRGRVLTPA
jgi:leucyl aminopeptidase (aminopeptidase T)